MVSSRTLYHFLFASSAAATSVLLPLYIYPLSGAYTPVYNAVAANASVHWQIVINPNSGPGPAKTYPNSDYITAISKLNSYKNVELIGYVPTNYTNRQYSSVTQDIATYAYWATYTAANLSINGIFFDEAPYATGAPLTYMANASTYAYDNIPTAATTVIFNPGTNATAIQYFDYADSIVEFENFYSKYAGQSTINGFPRGYYGQSAVVVHNSTASNATLTSLVRTGKVNGLSSMYFTTDCCYNSLAGLPALAAAFSKS